jgi:hypothetical protein
MRFSQMACYRFAETNAPFMKLYENNMMEYRKTRRFLSRQIENSPEGKKQSLEMQAESAFERSIKRKLKTRLIEEEVAAHK